MFDNDDATNVEYFWAKKNCRVYAGSNSAWVVEEGADGSTLTCNSDYPDDADSWMIYGPFSLADATDAEFSFVYWLNSESAYDILFAAASIDGVKFFGEYNSGTFDWTEHIFDLTDVHTLGDLTGQSQVWVMVAFQSDSSVHYSEGAYVDNIVLRKYIGTEPTSSPEVTPTLLVDDVNVYLPLLTNVSIRIPLPGDNATSWGWANSIQIWGTDFEPYDCHNTGVLDFICDADVEPVTGLPFSKTGRCMHYWNQNAPMTFEAQVPLGIIPKTVTVYFWEPVKNVVITSGPRDMVYIDSIVGITLDGTRIPIGFTLDENGLLVPAPLFFDGLRAGAGTYLEAERNMIAPPVCGMVGLQNDNDYMEMGGFKIGTADGNQVDVGSFILFRLPQTPASQLTNNDLWAARGVKAYEIAALEITALYNNPPNNICP